MLLDTIKMIKIDVDKSILVVNSLLKMVLVLDAMWVSKSKAELVFKIKLF